MKIETFGKRFGENAIPLLKNLMFGLMQAKNGKFYNVHKDKKGFPVAKCIKKMIRSN